MNFVEAEQYLLSFTDYEKVPGIAYTAANYDLRRMELLLEPLGNPHLGTPTIHVAGTKGKGSTAAMIANILATTGYRTGLFTSPHLHNIRERARINNDLISEAEFASIITEIKPIVEKVNKETAFGQLTTFEVLTAAVFTYFKRNMVDFQVLEVGLGGRLDATNVAHGDICIITSISLDHTEVLGNTLSKIAAEKAGIIKEDSLVINFPQKEEVTAVIKKACQQNGCQMIQIGTDVRWQRTGGDIHRQFFTVTTAESQYPIELPLTGDFQLENAAAAIAAIESLIENGANISPEHILIGMKSIDWPGRLQILHEAPLVLADGAHNAYSMSKLIESVRKYFKYSECYVIFGSSVDKDVDGMARELSAFTRNITVTSSSHPRAASRTIIIEKFKQAGIEVNQAENINAAISDYMKKAVKEDLIVITGSLFVVAEAIRHFNKTEEL
jgi:dihydrofolate synthase/folylpolyglutamate synthase